MVDVNEGHEADFLAIAREFSAVLARKEYGRADIVRDEASSMRFYAVRHWASADAAELCHADVEIQVLTARLFKIARVTHVVNGVQRPNSLRLLTDDRRGTPQADRRTGFDRRRQDQGRSEGDRRKTADRRLGPRRLRDRPGEINLIAAARRAREHADAAFSHFKVGAALETGDGTVFTGCNVENATYGLTMCAERVAMFKALSEVHRAFTRIAIVADTQAPTPPCGACRQILWEFCGDAELTLINLKGKTEVLRMKDLFPRPFDASFL
jgi:cytidine deaminase